MDMMQTSTFSTRLTMDFAVSNWLKFISQTFPDTYYLPRYLIPKFPPEYIMVNVLLHWCCDARIDLRRK